MRLVEHRRGITDPVLALTFDDGPSPWTLPIVEQLERYGSRGTFLVIGEVLEGDEQLEIARQVVAGGHEVGNHTFTHPDLQTLADDAIQAEMSATQHRIEEVVGTAPRFWRAPFFHCDARVRAAVGDIAGDELWHSISPGDWEQPADETARRVLADLAPGDIVVLHDGRPANEPAHLSLPTREATVAAVGLILDEMTHRGLRSVTVSELLAAG